MRTQHTCRWCQNPIPLRKRYCCFECEIRYKQAAKQKIYAPFRMLECEDGEVVGDVGDVGIKKWTKYNNTLKKTKLNN